MVGFFNTCPTPKIIITIYKLIAPLLVGDVEYFNDFEPCLTGMGIALLITKKPIKP
jgi:hypothetical protein